MKAGQHRLGPAVAMVFAVAGHVPVASRDPTVAPLPAGPELARGARGSRGCRVPPERARTLWWGAQRGRGLPMSWAERQPHGGRGLFVKLGP